MNLSIAQIQQLLEAGGLSWGAESVDHKDVLSDVPLLVSPPWPILRPCQEHG